MQAVHHHSCVFHYGIDIAASVLAQVICTYHEEHLLGLTHGHGFDMCHSLVDKGTPHASVQYVGVRAKGLVPFVHVGNAIAHKHYTAVVDGQNLEQVVLMSTECIWNHISLWQSFAYTFVIILIQLP